jgi:hypothetical protein
VVQFYLPLTGLRPTFQSEVGAPPFTLARRQWDVSTFDLATLATRHKLHLPYEAMALMLASVNCEMAVAGDISHLEALDLGRSFRAALYAQRVSPTVVPFVATHSVNQYAGINSRDSSKLPDNLPAGLREGITSRTETVEVWPVELHVDAWRILDRLDVTSEHVAEAARMALKWQRLSAQQKPLVALERALVTSPLISPLEQSVLHLWSAVEALFPKVSTEVVFRVALYLAQLVEGSRAGDRRAYARRIRKAYNLRSAIAHGSRLDVKPKEWVEAWDIACDVYCAVQRRGRLPSEDELEDEALG